MLARKVIHIEAADSPNVQLALEEQRRGRVPSGRRLLPGLIDWETYQHRLATWDAVRICQSIHGQFYEGAELLLFPPDWLNLAGQLAATQDRKRKGKSMGVDTAEGGDSTSFAISDELGLIHLESYKTPNTAVIPNRTIQHIQQYGLEPENVIFDQGGGGYEHVCTLRERGYNCRMVSFGEAATADPVRYKVGWEQKQENRRERFSYTNRRAQMYWWLHLRLEPKQVGVQADGTPVLEGGWGIPSEYSELRRQLSPIPRREDSEGRIFMIPKTKRPGAKTQECLSDLIGRSPDDADAVVLSIFGLDPGPVRTSSGAIF